MSVVGAAVILGLVVAVLLKLKVARASAVIVCVLFGLVLGATPVGNGVYVAVARVGNWASDVVGKL